MPRQASLFSVSICVRKSSWRAQDGHRLLRDGEDVWQHNAWDDMQWSEEQERCCRSVILAQTMAERSVGWRRISSTSKRPCPYPMSCEVRSFSCCSGHFKSTSTAAYNERPAEYWDTIYSKVADTMYKDRSWLRDEFEEVRSSHSVF